MIKRLTRKYYYITAALVLLLFTVLWKQYESKQTPFQKWSIKVSTNKEYATLTYLGNETNLTADLTIDGIYSTSYSFEDGTFLFPLSGSPNIRTTNEVKIKKGTGSNSVHFHTLQLVRETPEYLVNQFGFMHQTGYVIIQRNTFPLKPVEAKYSTSDLPFSSNDAETQKKVLGMLSKFKSSALHVLQSNSNDTQVILSKAKLITQFLWSLYDHTGPSNKIKHDMDTYQILLSIQSYGGSVQCQGTRDLFISIADLSGSGLDIRKVDAFRYYPFIDNIVVNGHAILEVKMGKRWFLFDPYARVFFKDRQGNRLLSADDIKNFRETKSLGRIETFHIDTEHEKYKDFDNNNSFAPYDWNYFSHFHYLLYTEFD